VVCGDEVLRATALLRLAQPRVSRAPRFRLRCLRAKVELGGLEWQTVLLCESGDGLSNGRTVGLNAVIYMRDDNREAELLRHTVQ
jgi:hypothetical protein